MGGAGAKERADGGCRDGVEEKSRGLQAALGLESLANNGLSRHQKFWPGSIHTVGKTSRECILGGNLCVIRGLSTGKRSAMSSVFLRKIERFACLSDEEKRLVRQVGAQRARLLGPRQDITSEGEQARSVKILEAGWACRCRMLPDGRRQIVALLLPGDACDFDAVAPAPLDHSVTTLTSVSLREIPHEAFEAMLVAHPRLREARWRDHMLAAAIQREWMVSLGQRNARERVAHLLCEAMARLELVGLADGKVCDFPLTQIDLGEATGLSSVHVNRTLQELRGGGLVRLRDRQLQIADFEALAEIGLFEPSYLLPMCPAVEPPSRARQASPA